MAAAMDPPMMSVFLSRSSNFKEHPSGNYGWTPLFK
jgi:hypothetical protein